jgi:hypothetical protein
VSSAKAGAAEIIEARKANANCVRCLLIPQH